jgi:hypothetical protein
MKAAAENTAGISKIGTAPKKKFSAGKAAAALL